jgi:quinol-cytochrome oxidoreductase complex cytochrome b subunit
LGDKCPFGELLVITNLLSIIPIYGDLIVTLDLGGHSVGQPTLNRFFLLHIILAVIVSLLVIAHLYILHQVHSNNPLGIIGENEFY